MSRVLYNASKDEFIEDVMTKKFFPKMKKTASLYHIGFGDSELNSWQNNAPQIQNLLILAKVPSDTHVSFEYRIPHGSSRIDCMLYGVGNDHRSNVIHLELKQWGNNSVSEMYSTGVFKVEALTGRHFQPVAHPSQQVANYQQYLTDYVEVFQDECTLNGMAYCYNYYSTADPHALYSDHYRIILDKFPLYSGDQIGELAMKINQLLCLGDGLRIFNNVQDSPIRPSKNLLDAAANMFRGITEFSLLEDQLTASGAIFGEIDKTISSSGKTVIIVKGGPGTGKTVIALHILAQLAQQGKYPNSFFTTRSKALRNNLRIKLKDVQIANNRVGDAGNLVRDIFDFKPYNYKENELDVLLVDEAHRISKSSNFQTDKKYETTYLSQVISLIYCAKVCVFFIDDHQAITSSEIGTSAMIKAAADNYLDRIKSERVSFLEEIKKKKKSLERLNIRRQGILVKEEEMSRSAFIHALTDVEGRIAKKQDEIKKEACVNDVVTSFTGNVNILDFELKSQFRCNGSDNYLDWLDEVLYKSSDKVRTSFEEKDFDFKLFDSPHELYKSIRKLDDPHGAKKRTARLAAGYCWDWKGELTPDGDITKEVVIGDFAMPWETLKTPRGPYRDMYASSADTWAVEPAGINQIGCVFSIQGLEIDYIGVIIGPDLTFDKEIGCLKAIPGITHHMNSGGDPDKYVKNIYRVLLSRGKRGCYVYSCDPSVTEYLRECLNKVQHK